ncbi:MAG: MBL fold metallo-hydrolase [Anaerovoracaceae bacterium]|jgi:glyoxylase-like metal-dependent hydrolase (beta-lactamase superfamily II)
MGEIIKRVSAGKGGEALLIKGAEKSCLYDSGMAYCGDEMAENVRRELKGGRLDFIILSHTHYDHIGGVPYIRRIWPEVKVLGSVFGQPILEKPKALATIRSLAETAARKYAKNPQKPLDYDDRQLAMDIGLTDGSVISLGDMHIKAYATKGHTPCSMSYFIEEEKILLASESTGLYLGEGKYSSSILTGYGDAMESIEKCRNLGARSIYAPHYLEVEKEEMPMFWDRLKATAEESKDFILECLNRGYTQDEVVEICTDRYWRGFISEEQPREAYWINQKAKVKVIAREFMHEINME